MEAGWLASRAREGTAALKGMHPLFPMQIMLRSIWPSCKRKPNSLQGGCSGSPSSIGITPRNISSMSGKSHQTLANEKGGGDASGADVVPFPNGLLPSSSSQIMLVHLCLAIRGGQNDIILEGCIGSLGL